MQTRPAGPNAPSTCPLRRSPAKGVSLEDRLGRMGAPGPPADRRLVGSPGVCRLPQTAAALPACAGESARRWCSAAGWPGAAPHRGPGCRKQPCTRRSCELSNPCIWRAGINTAAIGYPNQDIPGGNDAARDQNRKVHLYVYGHGIAPRSKPPIRSNGSRSELTKE
jgi:hypothetical protein